jgi:uncharacterized membrane protein
VHRIWSLDIELLETFYAHENFDNFGDSVSISGNTVIVGAWQESSETGIDGNEDDNSLSGSGAAYVIVRDVTTNKWSQQAYLKASNAELYDEFDYSVDISGETIVVGAWQEEPQSSLYNSGAAYVFVRDGNTWSEQQYLKASNAGWDDKFGCSVSISGDTTAVGAKE